MLHQWLANNFVVDYLIPLKLSISRLIIAYFGTLTMHQIAPLLSGLEINLGQSRPVGRMVLIFHSSLLQLNSSLIGLKNVFSR